MNMLGTYYAWKLLLELIYMAWYVCCGQYHLETISVSPMFIRIRLRRPRSGKVLSLKQLLIILASWIGARPA